MASFGCVSREILERILHFLPLRDQINSGFVCAHWNEIVRSNLKHVTIDASMPFGGRWIKENLRWTDRSRYEEIYPERNYDTKKYKEGSQDVKVWCRGKNDPTDKEMKRLLLKLCKLTKKLETLNIENYHLDTESLTELFSGQKTIKNLRIKIHKLPAWVRNAYFEKIVEVIISNQETIEVIEIRIGTSCAYLRMPHKSVRKVEDIIACHRRLNFPRLKSLKLAGDADSAIKQLSNDLFESLIATSQLEELKIPYLHISAQFKLGNLGLLKKLSLSYYETYAAELIKHCPNITNLVGYQGFADPWQSVRSLRNIIWAYGPKLKSLGCRVVRVETVTAIVKECKAIESLVLDFQEPKREDGWFDESLAIESSIPLLGYLERLTEIEFYSRDFKVKPEIICELITRCGVNLQSFTLDLCGSEIYKILNAVGARCKNLKKLWLDVCDILEAKDWGGTCNRINAAKRGTMKETHRSRQLEESVDVVLEGCQKLTTLFLHFGWRGWRDLRKENNIYDQISKKQLHLKRLTLENHMGYPKPNFVKLIQALPYCNIFVTVH